MKRLTSFIGLISILALVTGGCAPASDSPASATAPAAATDTALPTLTKTPTPAPTAIPPTPTLAPVGDIQPIPQGYVYLGDKNTLALGFNMNGGGGIGSLLYNGRELIDDTDYGRYFQFSMYDGNDKYAAQGSDPYGNWGWNPIQVGSKAGGSSIIGAKVLEYRKADDAVYIKALGKEWGKYDEDSDVTFETWAWKRDGYFEVFTRATHFGNDTHALATHEFPAAYFHPSLTRMFGYFDDAPFTGAPMSELDHRTKQGEIAGTGNCPFVYPTENWAAFTGADKIGLILLLPSQPHLEPRWNFCLLYDAPTVGYAGPLAYFDVPPQAVRDLRYYLIPGQIDEARGVVYDLMPHTAWNFDLDSPEGWRGDSLEDSIQNGILTAHLSKGNLFTSSNGLRVAGAVSPSVLVHARAQNDAARLCLYFITNKDSAWDENKSSCADVSAGAFQTSVFDMSKNKIWNSGVVAQIAFASTADAAVEFDSIQVEQRGQAWEFEFDGDVEGWLAWNQLASFAVGNGSLSARATGGDPYLGSPTLTLDAAANPVIEIRMAVSTGSSAKIYFITSSDKEYDETKALTFSIQGDGQFHTYTLDMSKVARWKGIIAQIRLDPTDAASSIEIDYIRVAPK
ncbi:MAG: hypothetical protein HYZ24_16940 [Chloroflexi bacterium]|jgi:hypothetical protein|nr:hypothetical protein [Chloroflexota bacterium]